MTGPEDATKGIIDIYDIFGFAPQTTQGADLLSAHTGAIVLLPDFFKGEKLDPSLLPVDTEEKKQKMQSFMQGPANFQENVAQLISIRREVSDKYPNVEGHWGVFGLCWGGKIAVLACGQDNHGSGRRFNVSGTAHPG